MSDWQHIERPTCETCGTSMFPTRRTPNPATGQYFEDVTFTCLECRRTTNRTLEVEPEQ